MFNYLLGIASASGGKNGNSLHIFKIDGAKLWRNNGCK
jgi:hypothetical protein